MLKSTELDPPICSAPPAGSASVANSNPDAVEILIRGKKVRVPCVRVHDRTVSVSGRWLKIASVFDEEAIADEVVKDPESFLRVLKAARSGADIFTFSQRLPDTQPKYSYPLEMDNSAVVSVTTYDEWFNKRIGTDVKQNIKKASKRGVVVRIAPFDDELVRGIVDIYNESPIRQGRRFWHYGKDFATVKAETAHCLERSEFIGAYSGDELIGFVKLLRVGLTNDLVLIVSKQSHFDKKPTNALIAKAVEVCADRGVPYLTYAKFAYGNKANSSLVEFKRRHGFERVDFPRYYAPLTAVGRLAVRLKLYRGLTEMLPEQTLNALVNTRSWLYKHSSAMRAKAEPNGQGAKGSQA
jgi:hypothetical protein